MPTKKVYYNPRTGDIKFVIEGEGVNISGPFIEVDADLAINRRDWKIVDSVLTFAPDVAGLRRTEEKKINEKRAAVIEAGTTINIDDYGPVRLGGRKQDRENLHGLAFSSSLRLGIGDNETLLPFRDADNVVHLLNPSQMIELFVKGARWVSRQYTLTWGMKDGEELPEDWVNDPRWGS